MNKRMFPRKFQSPYKDCRDAHIDPHILKARFSEPVAKYRLDKNVKEKDAKEPQKDLKLMM